MKKRLACQIPQNAPHPDRFYLGAAIDEDEDIDASLAWDWGLFIALLLMLVIIFGPAAYEVFIAYTRP